MIHFDHAIMEKEVRINGILVRKELHSDILGTDIFKPNPHIMESVKEIILGM